MVEIPDRQDTNKAVVVLLITLFAPYVFGFLTGSSLNESALTSADKILRVTIIYVFTVILLLKLRKSPLPMGSGVYFWLGATLLTILLLHYAYARADEFNLLRAKKELFRLAALIVLFMLCAAYSVRPVDHTFLAHSVAAAGVLLGAFAIHHSLYGESEMSWRYVAGFLRAGTEITDASSFGALLNMTSMAAIAGFLISGRRMGKIWFLCSFSLIQVSRFFTFSTGSFFSMVISLCAGFYLLAKFGREYLKRYSVLIFSGVVIITVLIATTGLFDAFFYRIRLSDEFVRRASVESRLEQHLNFLELIKAEPSRFLIGYGTATFPNKLGLGLDLHDAYLRPLGVAGILGFLCFNALCVLCLRNFLVAIIRSAGDLKVVSIFFFVAFIGWSFQAAVQPDDTSVIQWFFFIVGYVLMRSACLTTGHDAQAGQVRQII